MLKNVLNLGLGNYSDPYSKKNIHTNKEGEDEVKVSNERPKSFTKNIH